MPAPRFGEGAEDGGADFETRFVLDEAAHLHDGHRRVVAPHQVPVRRTHFGERPLAREHAANVAVERQPHRAPFGRTQIRDPLVRDLRAIGQNAQADALLATLGGQTALNAAISLSENGVLDKYGVELIGASIEAINRGENRESFKRIVEELGGEVAKSVICHSMEDCLGAADELGYPMVVRPSFTMGGTGSGMAYDEEDLRRIGGGGLAASPTSEVLLEESIIGWKEYELEVMRDTADNVVIVCSIENLDPMGVHTGDSITVAPAMTLTDVEYQGMRDDAVKVMRAIGVREIAARAGVDPALVPHRTRDVGHRHDHGPTLRRQPREPRPDVAVPLYRELRAGELASRVAEVVAQRKYQPATRRSICDSVVRASSGTTRSKWRPSASCLVSNCAVRSRSDVSAALASAGGELLRRLHATATFTSHGDHLENLGLDVTHQIHDGHADVILNGAQQRHPADIKVRQLDAQERGCLSLDLAPGRHSAIRAFDHIGRTSTTSGTKCFSRFWMPCCSVAVDDGQPAQDPFMLR
mgnify:CR=1 FL=1